MEEEECYGWGAKMHQYSGPSLSARFLAAQRRIKIAGFPKKRDWDPLGMAKHQMNRFGSLDFPAPFFSRGVDGRDIPVIIASWNDPARGPHSISLAPYLTKLTGNCSSFSASQSHTFEN